MVQVNKTKQKIKKTPTVLQTEAVECGAAALGMILGYHGKFVSLEELRYECGVSRDGSNALNILKAARHYGLQAKGIRTNLNKIKDQTFPLILFLNTAHFVVLEGIKNGIYYLNDPAVGHRRCDETEFLKTFSGIVLVFEPTEDFKPSPKKPADVFSHIKDVKINRKVLLYLILCAFFLTVSGFLIPSYSKIFIDRVLIEQRTEWLQPLVIAMSVTAFLTAVIQYFQHKTVISLENSISVKTAAAFFDHAIRLPLSFYSQRYAASVNTAFESGENIAKTLGHELIISSLSALFSVFYIVIMLQYDILLTCVSVAFLVLNIFLVSYSGKRINEEYHILLTDEMKLSMIAVSGIKSIETLKATGQEDVFFKRLLDQYTSLQNMLFRISRKTRFYGFIPTLSQFISVTLILLIGGLRIMDSTMSIGSFVAFQTLTAALYEPVQRFLAILMNIQKIDADRKRLDDVMRYPLDEYLNRKAEEGRQIHKKLEGSITIKDLTFGYARLEEPLIENFTLSVKPGDRVALVGASGSGKSTLGKLISGLLQPWSGEILFDGKPFKSIPVGITTASLAYVEQDVILFSGSVRDNITMWAARDENYFSEEEIIRAAKDACIHEEITAMIDSEDQHKSEYDYHLMEFGKNISGGMRQRIEIARCLCKNPSILIMDEATSALDSKTEMQIDLNLRKRGCTTIVISHRLSTIRDCDEIIVLDKGKVVQRGTHEELMKENGVYTTLIEM